MDSTDVKREPLLDEYQDPPYFDRYDEYEAGAFYDGVDFARDFYEAMITSGELVTRKDPLKFTKGIAPAEVNHKKVGRVTMCEFCSSMSEEHDNYCRNCGGKIIIE